MQCAFAANAVRVIGILAAAAAPAGAAFAEGSCPPASPVFPTFRPDNTNSVLRGTGRFTGGDFAPDGRVLQWVISASEPATGGVSCRMGPLVEVGTELDEQALASTCESDFIPYIANGWELLPLCSGVRVPREREAVDLGMHARGMCVVDDAPDDEIWYARTQLFYSGPGTLSTTAKFIANDGGAAWVNGEVVAVDNSCSSAALQFADEITVTLREGFNDILVKTRNAENERLRNSGFNFAFEPALIESGQIGPVVAAVAPPSPSSSPSAAPTGVDVVDATLEDIQSYEDDGPPSYLECFNSELQGLRVMTSGVVTGLLRTSFFIQDDMFAIGVYLGPGDDRLGNLAVGDEVSVTGTVDEFGGFSELVDVSEINILTRGNPVEAIPIQPGDLGLQCNAFGEALEGMLVVMTNVTIVNVNPRFDEVFVMGSDGGVTEVSGEIHTELLALIQETCGSQVIGCLISRVVGLARYSFGSYEILPRNGDDISFD